MSCTVLVRTRVLRPERFDTYRQLAGPSVVAHGGSVLSKSKVVDVLEGEDSAQQIAVLSFPDADTARGWYASDAYQQAIHARAGVAEMTLTLLQS